MPVMRAIADVGGGFDWRLSAGGGFSGITLGEVFDDLNGDTFNIIRYDTPTIAGFTLSVAWGEDDLWDVALYYEKELGAFQVAAGIGYTENRDNDDDGPLDQDTLAGSISVLHTPTGINLTFAAGEREFNDQPGRADADFYYFKAGIFQRFNSLGKTAFYGEYGQYNDMFYDDGAVAAGLGAAVIDGSEATVWGAGVVQYIDAAAMQVFLAYRHHELEIDTNLAADPDFEDFRYGACWWPDRVLIISTFGLSSRGGQLKASDMRLSCKAFRRFNVPAIAAGTLFVGALVGCWRRCCDGGKRYGKARKARGG